MKQEKTMEITCHLIEYQVEGIGLVSVCGGAGCDITLVMMAQVESHEMHDH